MTTNIAQTNIVLNIPRSLKIVGIVSGCIGVLTILLSSAAYMIANPGSNLFVRYLSDIGATPTWPQVFFNTGMLIVSPLRYVVLVLLVLRLSQLGTGRPFAVTVLSFGVLTTLGTIIMSAVPYTVNVNIHKLGIPLFFFGVVFLQLVVGLKEWQFKALPRILPVLCFSVVAIYLIFFTLQMLQEAGAVSREAPAPWEWLCSVSLIAWVFVHAILLGRETNREYGILR